MRSLEDEVVVITGGTRGIGKALVKEYLKKGAKVATFSSNPQHVNTLVQEFSTKQLYVETFDINHQSKGREFIKRVMYHFGKIDTLILNSGICRDQSFLKMTEENWHQVINTNLVSLFGITQEAFRQMSRQTGTKYIFLVSSTAGVTGVFGQANYAASKAGMIGFANTLALEGQKYQIIVNTIFPAALTEMTQPIIAKVKARCQASKQSFPDYWKIGTPQELAQTFLQLTTQLNGVTGSIFKINGLKHTISKLDTIRNDNNFV